MTPLLRTVKANHSVTGLRDLAMFTGFFIWAAATARSANSPGATSWKAASNTRPAPKAEKDHFEKANLPKPVYNSIIAYLNASDRLETIQPGDYLFIAHSDRARHLKRRDGQPVVAADYAPGSSPVSSREVGRVLKKYGRKAGLDETKLHVHVLRHTAAMLRKAVGDQLEDISKMLGHANFNTTKIYLDHMEGHKDISWRKVEALIGLPLDD